MVQWLAPIALFWTIAAMYFGGFKLNIEGGTFQQVAGLLVTFVLYMVLYTVARIALTGVVGTVAAIAFGCAIASLLMPFYAPIACRLLGVRITKAAVAHH